MKQVLAVVAFAVAGLAAAVAAQNQTEQGYVMSADEAQVAATERAFAQSMANRDFDAFASFLDDETVFWGGGSAARGKAAVMARWKRFYDGADAPFAWEPETVLVLESGNLALSTGPVSAPGGRVFAYFTSTWRKNERGEWKIIFDKGQRYCPPPQE